MTTDTPTDLNTEFEAAFYASTKTYTWNASRARHAWIDLEVIEASIAGPLYSIVNTGGCAYVYTRDDEYFTGVTNPDTLLARLKQSHDKLAQGVEDFVPANDAEAADQAAMRGFTAAIWAVTEKAIAVERQRWLRERLAY